ncbi:Mov34-domain-containing protein [Tilletiaria anomala UBC 951]|uniref:Eukaryotic translation initiation factor 3 subunit F n=1 Tax=Tilletiaria anomala (strain ATCC 24038 / CBS 436.72 / UBC 951) TaxID=1037660 RepID=A0A066VK54_TILAU|nr:Mov34-domain-containing protein [Tilletiaria anomala UBC 951]KDN38950.1 Mov34-domain-containing protein [Tilletiaria anomala UBC 951]
MSLIASSSSALNLAFPPSVGAGAQHSRSLSSVSVHPVALFSILDHYLRRRADAEDARVIGTLLGTRTESEVEIRSAFAVPHDETEDQVSVEIEYHRSMLELHTRANPNEVVVGWYATGSDLNSYSALIQDFYSKETAPQQAVHLTMNTDLQDENLGVRAWVSSPIGLTPKASSTAFLPLPVNLFYSPSERPALSMLASQTSTPMSDMDALAASLKQVQAQLDRVLTYVRQVISGERRGDPAIGRFILDAISKVPVGSATNENGESKLEELFNTHLQDILMVSYLANVVRGQAEISSRLTLLTA